MQFIGRERDECSRSRPTAGASYTFKGDEGYVRAKVIESNGAGAWTQPVPVGRAAPRLPHDNPP